MTEKEKDLSLHVAIMPAAAAGCSDSRITRTPVSRTGYLSVEAGKCCLSSLNERIKV